MFCTYLAWGFESLNVLQYSESPINEELSQKGHNMRGIFRKNYDETIKGKEHGIDIKIACL